MLGTTVMESDAAFDPVSLAALASSNELGIDVGGFALSFEVQAAIIVVGFVVGMAFLPRPQRKTR